MDTTTTRCTDLNARPGNARIAKLLLDQLTIARNAMREAEHIADALTSSESCDDRHEAMLKAIARSAADLLELFDEGEGAGE